jgi:valyl-tRNA synthetase
MSTAELSKQYDPQEAQKRWYSFWLEKGYFHADPSSNKPPYTIVIPPPNVTGALHLGHALNNTIQDILIRWRRMQGFDALWMPGTDHAGIATQAVVEKRLRVEENKTRHDIGREELVRRIWAWKDEYEARILSQLRLMGCSCDWERTRFTLDETCAKAVRTTFFRLFQDDKIFRGKRLVNWDTHLRTAVADDEIEYVDTTGQIWTIRYPVTGSDESLQVATTRPETMLGDTAVAVHPSDERYQHLIGKTVTLPLSGREIPIIADAILVDPTFGTGCVKVTPAHDPNDYACGVRNRLEMINLLNPDGTYNEEAGTYAGLDRREVRKRVVADLEAQGLLIKVETHTNRVGLSDRSKTPIEPYLSDQWFVRMDELAQGAMDAVTSGQVKIHPERYKSSYLDWLGEKRDWCISRQLWWGHRIPVWSKAEQFTDQSFLPALKKSISLDYKSREPQGVLLGDSISPPERLQNRWELHWAAKTQFSFEEDGKRTEHVCIPHFLTPEEEAKLIEALEQEGYKQDPDVLDTWFSSALWPHSTLGWPKESLDLAKYYPTNVLSTARDIITLWVARMVIFGQFNMGEAPFKDVYIHPVIQDGNGKRMSKSAGNGIDPVDIIDLFGADTLRFALASLATETQDIRIPVEKATLPDGREVNTSERFEQARTFPNKVWNFARLVLMNLEGYEPAPVLPSELTVEDRWILSLLAKTTARVTIDLEYFRFAEATKTLRDFTWNDVCDWYVEFLKGRLRDPEARSIAQRVLAAVLDCLTRLLHPIVPFLTESIWQALGEIAPVRGLHHPEPAPESVCIAPWPNLPETWRDLEAEAVVAQWQEKITAIRTLRAERKVNDKAKIHPIILAEGPVAAILQSGEAFIKALTNAETLTIASQVDRPAECAVAVLGDAEILLPLEGLIDKQAEQSRLRKSLADAEKQKSATESKLNNEAFISRAPADVVEKLRLKLAELIAQIATIEAAIKALTG